MSGQIIDYFGKTHSTHIHARGKTATVKLIELLNCQPGERILEMGFGSGATLMHLASTNKESHFQGVETSEIMYRSASKRLRFCGLSKAITLDLIKRNQETAFGDNSFDKVFIESVLGIQQGDGLKEMLREIHRILKPNGILVFNETIWLNSVEQEEAERINAACLNAFGIIQSSSASLHIGDWTDLLNELGFEIETVIKTDELTNAAKFKFNLSAFLSNIYTLRGKLKRRLSPALQAEWKQYKREMAAIMPPNRKMMEGIIIKAINKK